MTESDNPWDGNDRDFDPVESLILSFKYDPQAEKLFIAINYAAEVVDAYFRHRMVEGKSLDSWERPPTDFRGMCYTGVKDVLLNRLDPTRANISWSDIEAKFKREARVITLYEQSNLHGRHHLKLKAQHGFEMEWTYNRLAVVRRLAMGEDTADPERWIYKDITTQEIVDPLAPFSDDWAQIDKWFGQV
tara:strand:- start:70 stop:636 length:567 start_codon:yes stop_codon:yes gene_type:complete